MTSQIDYFTQLEIDQAPVCDLGRMDPITKQFGVVTVTLSINNQNGPFLNFQGLKIASSITISCDFEQINEIVHLFLTSNAHMMAGVE